MDAVARIESRILDVQARFAQLSGRTSFAPVASTTPTTASSAGTASGATSFRDIAASVLAGSGATSSGLDALSTSSTARSTGIASRAPGSYGPITLPAELAGQQNGRLADASLESIGQGDHRLARSAAVAFRRMAAAAEQDGVSLRVSDSYRTLADQERTAGAVGLYREGGLAAVPGTSNHGWGLSIDLKTDDRTQRWLRTNAARFGFAEDVAREPWHYTYRPADV